MANLFWKTKDGISWEQVNADGFGTAMNDRSYLSRVLLDDEYLFAGTDNADGAQLWKVAVKQSIVMEDTDKGEVKVVGPEERKGVINPDKGDKAEIYFKGEKAGKFTLRIYTLLGELIYEETKDSLAEGKFSWIPGDIASGTYIVSIEGPGVKIHKKVAILR